MHFYFFLSHFILQYLILVYFRFFAFLFLLLSILNLLRYKYRLNINHAYLLSRHLLYCADHRMYNRLLCNSLKVHVCVRVYLVAF